MDILITKSYILCQHIQTKTKRILTTNINSLRVTNKVALQNAIKRTKSK